MSTRWICLALAALLCAGCGYIGDPRPPALHIPRKVTDLRVFQHAGQIIVEFTIPELTTEDLPLKLGKVELRAGPNPQADFDADVWTAQAKLLDTAGLQPGHARREYSASEWTGREVFFRVRVSSSRGRDNGWSNFAILTVIAPIEKPSGLRAEPVREGVRLAWEGPDQPSGLTFRVRRRAGKETAVTEVGSASGREWIDTETHYGESYEYSIQATIKAGESTAESELSDAATITPVDRFPPGTPQGLLVLAGSASVELTWDPNTEADLGGYFLYRAVGDGPFERVGGPLNTPSYSDKSVKTGAMYRYAVSAVDLLANESERSKPVEITLP